MDKLLSLCMIVKDEEKVLKKCLDSVKDIVDEIFIIDTGSSDHTKEIASQYTNHIYDYTWNNDFAAARNESIKNATGKWILVMDADEYVDPEEFKLLRQTLQNLDHTNPYCLAVSIYSFLGKHGGAELPVERIFSNLPSISYIRPIHEKIVCSNKSITYITSKFRIYHTGYLEETRNAKDKSNRNLSIFETMLKQKKPEPYDYFTLANEYFSIKQFKKAHYYFERAYQRAKKNEIWFSFFMFQYIICLCEMDRFTDAFKLTNESIQKWGDYPEFYTVKGSIYQDFGLFENALSQFKTSINISEKASTEGRDYWLVGPDYGSVIPYQKISEIYFDCFDIQKANYYLTKILQIQPTNRIILFKLINLLTLEKNTEDIIRILSLIYENSEPTTLSMLLEICILAGNKQLVSYYYIFFDNNNYHLIERHMTRYALLMDDKNLFDQLISNESLRDKKILIMAACIWRDITYLDFITNEDSDWMPLKYYLNSLFNNLDTKNQVSINSIVSILSDLFRMNQYEAYDWLIQQFPDHKQEIANQLGDYFFMNLNFDLAVDYYSTIDPNFASKTAFQNLGRLSIHQGFIQDGLDYFTKAIEKARDNVQLYILRYLNAKEPSDKSHFKSELIANFPQYRNLPFISEL
jgi:glycosyltransferase involved in cell wall biosynthesis